MTRIVKFVVRCVIAAAAPVLIWRTVWIPLSCNRETIALENATRAAFTRSEFAVSKVMARDNLERTNSCLRNNSGDVSMLMIAAANQMLLEDYAGARASYAQALRFDQRPEIFLQLAITEARTGDDDAARRHALEAVEFNPPFLNSIGDGLLRARIDSLVQREYASRGNLVFNANMAKGSKPGRSRQFDGTGMGGPSAASGWWLVNGNNGSTRTDRVAAAPASGGEALHVIAGCSFCGILQTWAPAGGGPAHVQSSIRIYVKSGRVMISSGTLGHGQLDAVSTSTGRWETVSGMNHNCPVNHVRITSYKGQAEFYVTNVNVTAVPAQPCAAGEKL